MSRFIDLSHIVEDRMITYPGLPGPVITDHLTREASRERYAPGTEFQIGRIDMVANTGTYLDAPAHRWADGVDLAGLALESLAQLPGVVIRARGPAIDVDAFERRLVEGLQLGGAAVLVHTGWDRHWGTAEYGGADSPFVTRAAAAALVEAGAALVGIDSVNIDDTADGTRPAHTLLLRAGIPIVEHLRGLEQLPDGEPFTFSAVPVPVRGMGTFPVRAFAAVG
jgi:kynurenine formamidase